MPESEHPNQGNEADSGSSGAADAGVSSTQGSGKSQNGKIDVAEFALGLVESRGLQLFCDELRTPCVQLPDDEVQPVWPLYDQRVKAWFAEAIHSENGILVTDNMLLPALRVLEGRAWKVPRRLPTDEPTWELLRKEPVGLALITYANQKGDYSGLSRELFKQLHSPEIQGRLQMAALASKFPANTQAFCRKVNELQKSLAVIGLDVSTDRGEHGSTCELKMRPYFCREPDAICVIPSGSVRGSKSTQGTGLRSTDGTDAMQSNVEPGMASILASIAAIAAEGEGQQ